MRIEKISLKSSEMTDYTLISQEGTAGIPYATDSIYRNATNPRVLIRVVLIPFQTESEALEHLELFCNDMISSDLAPGTARLYRSSRLHDYRNQGLFPSGVPTGKTVFGSICQGQPLCEHRQRWRGIRRHHSVFSLHREETG